MMDAMGPDASDMRLWLVEDETAEAMLRRLSERCAPSITPMVPLQKAALHGQNVLEIAGPPGSGKSELLLQSIVTCILPEEWDGVFLGGSEKPVLYLDLDCRFNMRRIVHLIACRFSDAESRFFDTAWESYKSAFGRTGSTSTNQASGETDGQDSMKALDHESWRENDMQYNSSTELLIRTCLQRFYLKRCHSSFELLVTLKSIRAKLYNVAAQHGTSAELLVVDSIGAFYWLEKTTRSIAATTGRATLNLWTVSDAVVHELRRVIEMHPKLLIMATKSMILKDWDNESSTFWKENHFGKSTKLHRPCHRKIPQELFKSNRHQWSATGGTSVDKSSHIDFLPASWRGLVTHRIVLQGPYESDLAPTDRFLELSPSFFTAEWDKPFSNSVDFFVIQDARSAIDAQYSTVYGDDDFMVGIEKIGIIPQLRCHQLEDPEGASYKFSSSFRK